jgi:hypothetical protein
LWAHHLAGLAHQTLQVSRRALQLHLPCFDFGEVQDVVQNLQQVLRAGFGGLEQVALLVGERGVLEQVQHAQHAVHGGADFVAHVGEELGARLGESFRLGFGVQ